MVISQRKDRCQAPVDASDYCEEKPYEADAEAVLDLGQARAGRTGSREAPNTVHNLTGLLLYSRRTALFSSYLRAQLFFTTAVHCAKFAGVLRQKVVRVRDRRKDTQSLLVVVVVVRRRK